MYSFDTNRIRDEFCNSRSDRFPFVRYYFRRAQTVGRPLPLRSTDIDTEEALALAEADLASNGPNGDQSPPRPGIHVAALSIGRVCCEHDDEPFPVIEVRRNVIITPVEAKRVIIRGMNRIRPPHDQGTGAITMDAPVKFDEVEKETLTLEEILERSAVYMPRSNYEFSAQQHQGVISSPGGISSDITFGLSGDELLLPREPYPDPRLSSIRVG